MKQSNKRSTSLNGVYCGRCYLRLGIGEHYVIKDHTAYHNACYDKLLTIEPRIKDQARSEKPLAE